MPFLLHISDHERAYLDGLPLSPEAKQSLNRFMLEFIANITDEFRLNPENRVTPGSPYFRVQYLMRDKSGDGGLHSIDFIVRDDQAAFGVLLVVFIDHHC